MRERVAKLRKERTIRGKEEREGGRVAMMRLKQTLLFV